MPITPLSDALTDNNLFIDNEMQVAMRETSLVTRLKKAGLSKRSGDPLSRIIFCLLIWPLLKNDTIAAFCGRFIGAYLTGTKDVLYDFMKRQDIDWRKHSINSSLEVYKEHKLGEEKGTAFLIDDSLHIRRGGTVEGVSSHYDHTSKRNVMGHQLLQLCHCSSKGALPIDQHLYLSSKKQQPLRHDFKDKRKAVAKDYSRAVNKNKNQLFRDMLEKAKRAGFRADHVLGDAWFGNKENIDKVLQLNMTAIFMMKRSGLKYRYQGRNYTAKQLYQMIKRRMKSGRGHRFLTYKIQVEINLETDAKKEGRWQKVTLLFSKEKNTKPNSWVLILCTDTNYSPSTILKTYAMRWGIEVYFKEIKQNMGFMKEQSTKYAVHYASVHLTTMRYTLLFNYMLGNGYLKFSTCRKRLCDSLEMISFATILWEFFKAIIDGVLDGFLAELGEKMLERIKTKIHTTIDEFLIKALQIDDDSIESVIRAEQLGVL